jgi:hypothetical protein
MSLLLISVILFIGVDGSFRILAWFILAYLLLFPFILMGAMYKQVSANPVFTSRIKLSFGESGIISEGNGIKSERSWESLNSWSQSKEYFFLHIDKLGTALTIPRRAFTDQQMELFLNELKRNISDRVGKI